MNKNKRHAARLQSTGLSYGTLEPRQVLTSILPLNAATYHTAQGVDSIVSTNFAAEPEVAVQPAHGELIFNETNQTLTYRPDAGFTGDDQFELVEKGEFEIRVWEPVYAVPDWTLVRPDSTTTINVVANDYVLKNTNDQDYTLWRSTHSNVFDNFRWQQDATDLRIVEVLGDAADHISISDDGQSLVYTTANGIVGEDVVTYVIEDASGNRSEATVTFDVSNRIDDGRYYVSEAQFQQDQVESWMEQHASSLTNRYSNIDPYISTGLVTIDGGWNFTRTTGELTFATVNGFNVDANSIAAGDIQEGDIVKSNGDLLYYVTHDQSDDSEFKSYLLIIDVSDPEDPQVVSTTGFEQSIKDIYLDGDRAAVVLDPTALNSVGFWSPWRTDIAGFVGTTPEPTSSSLVVLDVSDSAAPVEVYQAKIDGRFKDARLIGDEFYLISEVNQNEFVAPNVVFNRQSESTPVSPGDYIDAMLEMENRFGLPTIEVTSNGDTETITVGLDQIVRRDDTYTATMITTFSLSENSGTPLDVDLVESNSSNEIHVSNTGIYLFDRQSVIKYSFVNGEAGVEFAADGQLAGSLLSQFSADEFEGHLRVAMTDSTDQSVDVRVMKQVNDALIVVGSVEDIAPGERIYSTHFAEDQVFIVTFRQIDPLFVIDLSNPTNPIVEGELKIPGVSNYLQLIGDDLLLAVGRDANEFSGRFGALQVSLFDVSNSQSPQLLDRYTFDGGRTTETPLIEWINGAPEHHALTFNAATGTLALPIFSSNASGWWFEAEDSERVFTEDASAMSLFEIDRENGIQFSGLVNFESKALRTKVVGEHIVYFAEDSLKTAALNTPTDVLATLNLPNGDDTSALARPAEPGIFVENIREFTEQIFFGPFINWGVFNEPASTGSNLSDSFPMGPLQPTTSSGLGTPNFDWIQPTGVFGPTPFLHFASGEDLGGESSTLQSLAGSNQLTDDASAVEPEGTQLIGADSTGVNSDIVFDTVDGFFKAFNEVEMGPIFRFNF